MRKVLIANRGEIACRIIRSCRGLGLSTVAVHSAADAEAMHVAMADEAHLIGPGPARESYLVVDRILDAARRSGADAIHPGYGFLSENQAFAEAVEGAGIAWIGPHPRSIGDMGDKARARDIAMAAGVPVLPGSAEFAGGDLAGLVEAAAAIGYPLLVKAAAGGGGIGMRRVDDPAQLPAIAAATQTMAEKAFANGAIYVERFIGDARHVEVQVFGFGDGRAVHLHERDCSVQRRFQKIIEESPAPRLPGPVRRAMADAAVMLCRHQRYRGAGTIEFIVDAASFDFYFLEMNTRIQVEHPVTEAITGVDLVQWQIDLARGRLDAIDQGELRGTGHAIECRLYAENPRKNFMPSPGRLGVLRWPDPEEGVRIDTGYREGDTVSFLYDPMIAKVICHAADRDAAIERMRSVLARIEIEGPATNLAFLAATMEHRAFREGAVSTSFVDRHKQDLVG